MINLIERQRKYYLTLIVVFIATLLQVMGKFDPGWAGCVVSVCGLYFGANVWQKKGDPKIETK